MFKNSRRTTIVGTALLLAALAACRSGQVFSGPPSSTPDGEIEIDTARAHAGTFIAVLTVTNHGQGPMVFDSSRFMLVGPAGELAAVAKRTTIPPKKIRRVRLDWRAPGTDFRNVAGYYIRPEGLSVDGVTVNLPPLRLGNPVHQPGSTTLAGASPPVATSSAPKRGWVGRLADAIRQEETEQQNPSATVAAYSGPRMRLKTPGTLCAAMPMGAEGVSKGLGAVLDDLLLTELQAVGFSAIGPGDINAMVGLEGLKDTLGCDDTTCMAELGGALGVSYLIAGKVAVVDGSAVLTLKMLDVRAARAVSRVSRIGSSENELPRLIGGAVQEMVSRSGL